VASLNVPAGAFVVSARAEAYSTNAAAAWEVDCHLWNGTTVATLGSPLLLDFTGALGGAGQFQNIPLLGWVQLSTPGTITLQCSTESSVLGNSVTKLKLSATQVGSLNVQ
jgi:hypothetical protein